jgi:hypothetical protein
VLWGKGSTKDQLTLQIPKHFSALFSFIPSLMSLLLSKLLQLGKHVIPLPTPTSQGCQAHFPVSQARRLGQYLPDCVVEKFEHKKILTFKEHLISKVAY